MSGSSGRSAADRGSGLGKGARAGRAQLERVVFLAGAATRSAVAVLGRRAEESARRGLIDWRAAERMAADRVRNAAGSLSPADLHRADPVYASAMAEIVPALEAVLGASLPGVVERAAVVDRATWVHENVAGFSALIGRVESKLIERQMPPGMGLLRSGMAIVNRQVTTRQVGYLLGFIGQRVLGQYDLALLSTQAEPGRLMFVDENIRSVAAGLEVPLNPFRTWIALHETTHAFEFEAHPWLRPYIAARLERQLDSLSAIGSPGDQGAKRLRQALRSAGSGQSWMEAFMSGAQKREFREIQAVMSLLEGFGEYVMDELGRDLVPDVELISARFHARRAQRTGFEKAMLRLTGMDLKMEQYRKGEQFVAAIARARGAQALRELWRGPETMPQPEEIDHPARWLGRVLPAAGGEGGEGR